MDETYFLNEISSLNNEMANAQRRLAKQHSEVIRLNDKLKEVNSNLEQFTSVASHDLKEPLRMVTGFIQLLKSKYGSLLDEKANSYIDYALEGGIRMQRMINNLLDYSRTGVNGAKSSVDLNKILSEVKLDLFKLIEDTNATIIIGAELPVLDVNKAEISRLFQNLMSNAMKFTKNHIPPVVQITCVESEKEWIFSIKDNGIGINKEKLNEIFEFYSRLHSKSEYEGTGIGLAICKKIVTYHGGHIWITSDEGFGSIFHFTLPKL